MINNYLTTLQEYFGCPLQPTNSENGWVVHEVKFKNKLILFTIKLISNTDSDDYKLLVIATVSYQLVYEYGAMLSKLWITQINTVGGDRLEILNINGKDENCISCFEKVNGVINISVSIYD